MTLTEKLRDPCRGRWIGRRISGGRFASLARPPATVRVASGDV